MRDAGNIEWITGSLEVNAVDEALRHHSRQNTNGSEIRIRQDAPAPVRASQIRGAMARRRYGRLIGYSIQNQGTYEMQFPFGEGEWAITCAVYETCPSCSNHA